MRSIRIKMGYSVAVFAELLGLKKATYQGYETGRRPTPPNVQRDAEEAYRRDREFFAGVAERVDAVEDKTAHVITDRER